MSIQDISNQRNEVISAVRTASKQVGVDFNYLLRQAEVESALDPSAKAKTSSASGLYQFTSSTWIDMVSKYGDKYGLSGSRQDVLSARQDPEKSAFLAAELANDNKQALKANWGGDVGASELYLAHFLGAGAASKFLNTMDSAPDTKAAQLFPNAAGANKSIFYDAKTGDARSVKDVYENFAAKFDDIDKINVPKENKIPSAQSAPMNYELASLPRTSAIDPITIMLLAKLDAPESTSLIDSSSS